MEGVRQAAELMAMSACTAPKAKGQDFIETRVIIDEDLIALGERMIEIGETVGPRFLARDGKNVLSSDCVLLVGLKEHPGLQLNCNGCGFDCKGMQENQTEGPFKGPNCALRVLDLGVALGSAVKTAAMLGVDNRIMYSVGVVAVDLGMMDSNIVMGIPMSARSKNIYYDRG